MTIKAEALDALLAAGATAEMIVALVKADGFAEEKRLAKKRGDSALRMRRMRAQQAPVTRSDACYAQQASHETPSSSFLEEVSKEVDKEEKKKTRKRGIQLPEDWKPSSVDVEYGRGLGLSESQIVGSAEDMRLWARGNEHRDVGRKSDWSATFKTWMRRAVERMAPRQQPLSFKEAKQVENDYARAALRKFASGDAVGSSGGGQVIGFLPPLRRD